MTTRRGYTLIEAIVSMAIIAMAFTLTTMALSQLLQNTKTRSNQATALAQVTNVIAYAVTLLREAQPSPSSAYPIVAASSTSLTFYASQSGTTIQQYRFFLNGTTLQQGVIQPTGSGSSTTYTGSELVTTLLTNVSSSSIFSYFGSSYTGSQAAMNPIALNTIRFVKMDVTFNPAANLAPGPYTVSVAAELRNLKDNY